MSLRRLQVSDFRCLHSTALDLDPRYTLISGPNASGKTSLLEAIHVLSRGRSFRTRHLDHLIRTGCDRFVIYGEAEAPERRIAVGVEGSAKRIRGRMSGERVESLSMLAAIVPAQIIDPEIHRLIEEGPSRRRRFLDWGVFHVEHAFVDRWQRYQRALKQRNAALKARQPRTAVRSWDAELVPLGAYISASRTRYMEHLALAARPVARHLLGMELSLSYLMGWAKDLSFEDALRASFARDLEAGATQVGPHRAEIAIRLDGAPVKDRISRGQQKLLAASLLMAQLDLLPREAGVLPTLLLDDPAAELDSDRLLKLIGEVSQHSVQLIVTSLIADFSELGIPGRRYAIDRGIITAND
jgi:DNA replication and repair protein RecF